MGYRGRGENVAKLSKIDAKDEGLIFTGERYQPEIGGDVQLEHLHRYAFAKSLVHNKTVLDIACGEGYGSALLSETAKYVTGVDIESRAVEHAKIKYRSDNLSFLEGDCAKIPLKSNSVDVVVSFETIEHHDQHRKMMEEIKRVLKPKGFLVISSPNKKEYSDIPNYDNPYHVKELYSEEFETLILNYFQKLQMLRQRVIYASAVIAENVASDFQIFESSDDGVRSKSNFRSIYDIAIASNSKLPEFNHSFLEVDINVVTAGHLKHITALSNTLDSVISDRDSAYEAIKTVEDDLKSELSQKEQHISELSASIGSVIADRDSAYEAKKIVEDDLKRELSNKDDHISELSRSLNAVITDRDSAYEAIRMLNEATEDIKFQMSEQSIYSQKIEHELQTAKSTFIWKVFGKWLGKAKSL